MRTTLDLDDEILAAAKRKAAESGSTLTGFVERALTALLAPRPDQGRSYKLRWKTHHGRLAAGVNIADRDSLLDIMEGRH